MSKNVLITRPEEEYADTASMVVALGYDPVPCPMLKIETIQTDFADIEKFQAFIFTSAGAIPPFCSQSPVRDIPVYTVGDITAERARQAGFTKVISAGADLAALEVLLRSENLPADKPLLHVSGVDVVRPIDLPGLTVERRVVYRAGTLTSLPETAQMEVRAGSPRFVLFYSARTAQAFADAIKKDRLAHQLMSTKALCLSDSMVESLRDLPWRGISVAQRPDRSGMQALLSEEKGMDAVMNSVPENQNAEDQNAIEPAEQVIERFGGIRPMATKMSVPVTTVQGWKKRNVIPGNRREEVILAARQNNIEISDILNKSVANDMRFSTVMEAAKAVDSQYPRSTPVIEQMPTASFDENVLLGKIKQAESRAVKKSALITVTVVSAVAIAAAILLGPGVQNTFDKGEAGTGAEVQVLREDVERIDAEVNSVKEDQFALKNLIPENMGQTIEDLKGTVSQLGTEVGTLSQAAKGAAAVIATDVMGPHAGDMSQRMSALQTQVQAVAGSTDLAGLLSRLVQMKQTPEGEQKLDSSSSQLADMLKGLNGDASQLEPQLQAVQAQPGTPLGQTLAGVPQTDLKAAAMLVALTQFRTSLHRSAPFEDDLLMMRDMVAKDDPEMQAAIDRLAPQASKGVLSPQGLSNQLKGMAGDIVVSSIKGEDVSIREKATARMNDVFQVQKNGELVTGTDTQAKIARAQKLLDEGKVDEAVSELQTLQGPALQTAQPLIDQALMTSLAQQVSTQLTGKVAAQLPTGATSSPAGAIAEGLSNMSPEDIGTSLGQAVKGAGGSQAPYTAGGYGLEGIMQTMESLGAPVSGTSTPIHMPQQ